MGAAIEMSMRWPLAIQGSLVMMASPGSRVSGGYFVMKLRSTSGTMPRNPAVVTVEWDSICALASKRAQQKSWYSFTEGV